MQTEPGDEFSILHKVKVFVNRFDSLKKQYFYVVFELLMVQIRSHVFLFLKK